MMLLRPISPAIAPDRSIAVITMRLASTPLAVAASAFEPVARRSKPYRARQINR